MNLHHHHTTHLIHFKRALLLGALLASSLLAHTGTTLAQPQDPHTLLQMAETAQSNGQHQAAMEILVSLRGQVPAAQLAGMLSSSELHLADYRMAELAAIAALRESADPWVSQHRDVLMDTLAQAARHLGEIVIEGLPAGLPVSTRDLMLGVTGQRVRLAEGPRVLTIRLPDGRRLLLTVNVVPGRTTSVDGSTANVLAATAPTAPTPASPFALPPATTPLPAGTPAYPAAAAVRRAAPAYPAAAAVRRAAPAYPAAAPLRPAYMPAPVTPTAPDYSSMPAGVHPAPIAGAQPLFQERPPETPPAVERAPNRYGLALDIGQDYGLEYASQQSQAIDSSGDAMSPLDNQAIVGGARAFFQHDLGEHLVLVTHLGFGYHSRRAASAWNLYGDPVFDLRVRMMKGSVMRFDLGESARLVFGRRGSWITSYIGLGGRVGVAVFRYHGQNFWRRFDGGVDATPALGTEVGYMSQVTLELGNYFGRKRTVEFGGSISMGKPLLSVSFHLGVSFNGW